MILFCIGPAGSEAFIKLLQDAAIAAVKGDAQTEERMRWDGEQSNPL